MIPATGYHQGDSNLPQVLQSLERYINEVPGKFRTLPEHDLYFRPAPGKWSKKEILGHLIDSAINNLKRFTEIQFLPQPYSIISYQQVELVEVNHYQDLPLAHLLSLWQLLNRQILYVVERISEDKLQFAVDPKYPGSEMKTLQWVFADYVAHLEHHCRQIFDDFEPHPPLQK